MLEYEPKEKVCERCGATAMEVLTVIRGQPCPKALAAMHLSKTICKRPAPHTECSTYPDMLLCCEECFTELGPEKHMFLTYDFERLARKLIEKRLAYTLEKALGYIKTGVWPWRKVARPSD